MLPLLLRSEVEEMTPRPVVGTAPPAVARWLPAILVVLALVVVQTVSGAPGARAQSVGEGTQSIMEGPQAAPFYHTDPETLTSAENGQVINSREVAMPAFAGYRVTEIAYRSTNSHDEPTLATATVVRPPHARPDGPVLSYQHYLNALGQHCAPTESLVNPTVETVQDNAMAFLRVQLDQGWTVIIPDHLGPEVAYRAGSSPVGSGSTGCARCGTIRGSIRGTAGSGRSATRAAASRPGGSPTSTASTRRTSTWSGRHRAGCPRT